MNLNSDADILDALGSDNLKIRDQGMRHIYTQNYHVISDLIRKNSGTEADAADVFQDAIIVLFEKVSTGQLELNCSIRTYLYSVSRNLWLNKLRRKKKMTINDTEMTKISIAPKSLEILTNTEFEDSVMRLMDKLKEDCKKILTYVYFDQLKMEAIAELMSFANQQVARNKKAKCLKKLRSIVEASPQLKNEFK